MDFNKHIDYTNLEIDATSKDIAKLCSKAIENGFEAVCVHPCYVTLAKEFLEGSNVNISTVISYKSGMSTPKTKSYEAIDASEMGADEIGLFVNIGALKDKDYDYVKGEIEEVRDSIDGKPLKVIVESQKIEEEELIKLTQICNETFINYIEIYNKKDHKEKTFKNIEIINKHKNNVLEIKASGCFKEEDMLKLIEAGVTRIGIHKIAKNKKEHHCEECNCKED